MEGLSTHEPSFRLESVKGNLINFYPLRPAINSLLQFLIGMARKDSSAILIRELQTEEILNILEYPELDYYGRG